MSVCPPPKATRRADFQCGCGKVKGEIHQPFANYKYGETGHLQCACKDCTGYIKAVLKEGSTEESFQEKYFDPAIPTINFYDSEVLVTTGREHLEHMKLSKRTENRRVFAKCCGSPVSISPDHSHLNLVYSNLVTPTRESDCGANEVPYPKELLCRATMCVHAANLDAKAVQKAQSDHPDMKIIPHAFAPIEIWNLVSRLVLLIGLGARGPGNGFPVESDKDVAIGIESIAQTLKDCS